MMEVARSRPQKRILVSAFACLPGEGSENGVGWTWAQRIARAHETWVLTGSRNRALIERAPSHPSIHWVFVETTPPRPRGFLGRVGFQAYYSAWQIAAERIARSLHRRFQFNLAHHVTIGAYWMPIALSALSIPILWGPVGGGEQCPAGLRAGLSLRARLSDSLRDKAQQMSASMHRVGPSMRKAAWILCKTPETERVIRRWGPVRTSVMSEVCLSAADLSLLTSLPLRNDPPIRFVSMGRMVDFKAFDLGLEAFAIAQPRLSAAQFWLIGDGPLRSSLERRAFQLRIGDHVRFLGRLHRRDALRVLSESDILVHPSLHDSGGWTIVEAMAAGRPVICLDVGGPRLQVKPSTGIRIHATSREEVVTRIAAAMVDLGGNTEKRLAMASACRSRATADFSTQCLDDRLDAIYADVLGSGSRSN